MSNRPLSRRQIAAGLAGATLLIGLVGWRVTADIHAQSRPDIAVHPGMYDLRQEMQRASGQAAPEGPK